MQKFSELNLNKFLYRALEEKSYEQMTPIQEEAYTKVLSGKDIVGVSQTGTGKTLAYLLPILKELKFSNQQHPRVLILVPTMELVEQVKAVVEELTQYQSVRVQGVYGRVNINTQAAELQEGMDVLIATPLRLYDLIQNRAILTRDIKKVVIDEVDIMLELGFFPQLKNILDLLPEKRQNMMFSATMTDDVERLIDDTFSLPEKITIAVSGTPLENIEQKKLYIENFYTKLNYLGEELQDKTTYEKVILFVHKKKHADIIQEKLEPKLGEQIGIVHSNKSQNTRMKAVEEFQEEKFRILIATDVMARGLDIKDVTHVINVDTPKFPENYLHRIGRTGRAEKQGHALVIYSQFELENLSGIEELMGKEIPEQELDFEVKQNTQLLQEERFRPKKQSKNRKTEASDKGDGFHEKKLKNQKENLGSSFKRKVKEKYKKPQRRGDKIQNSKKRKKK